MTITLLEARGFVDRAVERARAARVRVTVAVLNELGELVQLDRMDGAAPLTVDLAESKARTAYNFQRSTADVEREFVEHPERRAMIENVAKFKLVTLPGGLPIQRGGVFVGAIGVSGADGKDEDIARAAIA